jgi:hypothetical protein
MLGMIFRASPEKGDSFKFESFELSYTPIDGNDE